jgi:hypothetical protein
MHDEVAGRGDSSLPFAVGDAPDEAEPNRDCRTEFPDLQRNKQDFGRAK